MVVREDVPETAANQFSHLARAVDRFIVPPLPDFLERRLGRRRSRGPRSSQEFEVSMETNRFSIDLLDGGMIHGEQRRPFPALGRELGDDVLAGETVREQPREGGIALPLRELLAAWAHGAAADLRS
jgi:hypothetical protein